MPYIAYGIGAFIVLVIIIAGLRMDREYERGVIFRLGRFKHVKGPGLYWIIPFFDEKVQVDIRMATVDIESQETVTRDSVTIRVNAVLYFWVQDPEKAIITVKNYHNATYQAARATVGPDAIVGVTCHNSRHLAIEAADAGADYVAFGAFFGTATKDAKTRAAPEILEAWSSTTTVPCVAIGGITAANCGPLVVAGADFIAVVSAVWNHAKGPAAAVREFIAAIDNAHTD